MAIFVGNQDIAKTWQSYFWRQTTFKQTGAGHDWRTGSSTSTGVSNRPEDREKWEEDERTGRCDKEDWQEHVTVAITRIASQ